MDSNIKAKKVTVRFSRRLKSEMQAALVKSGYGLRGKSHWLKDTMISFLKQRNFIDFVEHGVDTNQAELTEVEAFYVDAHTIQKMREAFVQVRVKYPLFEGVQSSLIRAAVVYRLMFKCDFPPGEKSI